MWIGSNANPKGSALDASYAVPAPAAPLADTGNVLSDFAPAGFIGLPNSDTTSVEPVLSKPTWRASVGTFPPTSGWLDPAMGTMAPAAENV